MAAGSPVIKGDNTVVWGSGGVYSTGIIVSGSKQTTADKVEVKDNNGFVVAAIYFDQKNKCDFEMIVQTSAPTLAVGDQITICGVANCLVDELDEKWAQNDVRKFSVKATKYSGMTLSS